MKCIYIKLYFYLVINIYLIIYNKIKIKISEYFNRKYLK